MLSGSPKSKARGKSSARGSERNFTFYPALPRWAKFCRAYGADVVAKYAAARVWTQKAKRDPLYLDRGGMLW